MYDVHLIFFGSGSGDASLCRTMPLLLRSHFGSMCCTAGYRTPRWSAVLRSMVLIVFSCMLGPMTNVLACIGLAAVIIMLHRRCSPAAARSRGWQGQVLLRVKVTAEGYSESVTVERSSGHDLLDEAAVTAVEKWRFIPARRGTTAVACTVRVPIIFTLNN